MRKVAVGATWCLGVTGGKIEQQKNGKSRGFQYRVQYVGHGVF